MGFEQTFLQRRYKSTRKNAQYHSSSKEENSVGKDAEKLDPSASWEYKIVQLL